MLLELLAHRSLHGDIEYFSIVAHDLTDKKAAEEQLKQYRADIDHASRLVTMGELASSLAHELNQPLSAMVNYLRGGIERRFAGNDSIAWGGDVELPITRSIRTALRAGEIVHRMMDFTRKQEPVITSLALPELINDMIEFCESMADRSHVRVVTDIPPDRLPPVLGDRIQLEQVLLNLIVNAIEASESPEAETEPRTVRVRVTVQDADQIRVSVSDEGPGISDDDMSRLFDRFFLHQTVRTGYGGAGHQSLIGRESGGGELWATNLSEGGACFSFTLNTAD